MPQFIRQTYNHQKPTVQGNLPQGKVLFIGPHGLKIFICVLLALTTLTAFWQVRNNEFINLDDDLSVTDNPPVQQGITLKSIVWAFMSVHAGHWHPMTWLSHMMDYDLYGLNPGGHHMTNLLFHVVNTLLIFLLFQRMTGAPWRSAFLASLFAFHPLHVESVAWVAERKDVLCAFFWMLAMWTYVRYVEKPKSTRLLLVVLCFLSALMSKPMAVTLPFALLLLDYWPLGRHRLGKTDGGLNLSVPGPMNRAPARNISFRLIWEKIPLFFLTAALSLFTLLSHWKSGAISSLDKLPLEVRIENALVSYVKYMAKMIWPERFAVLYPHPIVLPLWEVAGAILLLVTMTTLALLARRRYPYLIVGWLWYLGTLVPVIGIVQAGTQAMADRFTYIPVIGLFIMVAYGVPDILKGWRYRKSALAISGGLAVSILMTLTILQVQHWQNSIKLFNRALQVTDKNYLVHNNLGVTLMRQGMGQEAFFHYMEALKINPAYADAHYNLGILLARQGREQEAVVHLVKALRIKPNIAKTHNDLGAILFKQGKIQEAMAHFSEAVRIDKYSAEARYNLGTAFSWQGRYAEALHCLSEALIINPKDVRVHNNLGLTLARQGKISEAIAHYIQALQINPDYGDAHYNLGTLLTLQGRQRDAKTHFYEVLRINPSDGNAHYNLGVILVEQGKNDEAVSHLSEAARIIPNYAEAHLALGMLYAELGKKDLALSHYRILTKINKNLANTLHQKISTQRN